MVHHWSLKMMSDKDIEEYHNIEKQMKQGLKIIKNITTLAVNR